MAGVTCVGTMAYAHKHVFHHLLGSHLGLFTGFLVSVYGISKSMVIFFLGLKLLCMWQLQN